jgi:hypothetical protein
MQRLFQPVDIASLILLRIVFGILGFADVFGTWIYYHMMKGAFAPEAFQFKYYGFEWVRPLPEPFMSVLLLSIRACAILVMLGKWYRISATLFAFGFTYTYFLEKAHYLNHGYLFCWIAFLMIFLPVNRQLSLDVKRPQHSSLGEHARDVNQIEERNKKAFQQRLPFLLTRLNRLLS